MPGRAGNTDINSSFNSRGRKQGHDESWVLMLMIVAKHTSTGPMQKTAAVNCAVMKGYRVRAERMQYLIGVLLYARLSENILGCKMYARSLHHHVLSPLSNQAFSALPPITGEHFLQCIHGALRFRYDVLCTASGGLSQTKRSHLQRICGEVLSNAARYGP